ncbi:unnamed protein product [Calicophoron daubneyi]
MELIILFWFFTEYCLRMWSAGCRSRYQTWRGRLRFARRPFCIVDIIVIVASTVVLAADSDRNSFAASALRGLRFFQILRMIRMDRRGGSFKLLASVVWAHRQELFTTIYIGFLGLLFSSFLIYLAEKKENEKITNYADALWWGVVTLCTVGYGDTVPRTWVGKIIAACCAVGGISFFALPAGILGSGFALKVQQHQRQKHLIRRRVPAATLIQCLWRCYAADPTSSSVATWKIHMRPVRKPAALTSSSSMVERGGFSRFGRFSTLRRRPEKSTTTSVFGGPHTNNHNNSHSNHETTEKQKAESQNWLFCHQRTSSDNEPNTHAALNTGFASEPNRSPAITEIGLTPTSRTHTPMNEEKSSNQKTSIEMTSTRPYASIRTFRQDPSSQNSAVGQRHPRLHKLSISRSHFHTSTDPPDSPDFNRPGDHNTPVVERKLTENDKVAIRIIRKVQYFVARRKFREALRPYDVKDVIEQYSAGHLDMLTRVKTLQARLDQILGKPGGKNDEVYDSRQSLASRVVKIERKIDTIEMKLDRLSEICQGNAGGLLSPVCCLNPTHSAFGYAGEVESHYTPMFGHADLQAFTGNANTCSSSGPHSRLSDISHRTPRWSPPLATHPSISHPLGGSGYVLLELKSPPFGPRCSDYSPRKFSPLPSASETSAYHNSANRKVCHKTDVLQNIIDNENRDPRHLKHHPIYSTIPCTYAYTQSFPEHPLSSSGRQSKNTSVESRGSRSYTGETERDLMSTNSDQPLIPAYKYSDNHRLSDESMNDPTPPTNDLSGMVSPLDKDV